MIDAETRSDLMALPADLATENKAETLLARILTVLRARDDEGLDAAVLKFNPSDCNQLQKRIKRDEKLADALGAEGATSRAAADRNKAVKAKLAELAADANNRLAELAADANNRRRR